MVDRRRSAKHFDNARELVSTKGQMVNGESLTPGDPISAEIQHSTRMKMWMSGRATYADEYRPTPVSEAVEAPPPPEPKALHLGRGVYEVTAPWLDAPETFEGKGAKKAASERVAQLIADGPPVLSEDEAPLLSETEESDLDDGASEASAE